MRKNPLSFAPALATAAVLLLVAGCGPTEQDTQDTSQESPTTSTPVESPAASPVDEPGDEADQSVEETGDEAEEEPETEPEWTPAGSLSGNANQQSDTITLTGGRLRLTYDFVDSTGNDMIVAAIYVLTEGTDLHSDGGIPEVMISEAGTGETFLRKGAGEYFLYVMSANSEYTVTLEVQE